MTKALCLGWAAALAVVPGVQAQVELQPAFVADTPVAITHAGDERLFVVEQAGRIRVHGPGNAKPRTFLDLRDRVTFQGEQGLLSVAFHPEYPRNGFFYVNYTDRKGATVVQRFRRSSDPDAADPRSGATLLRIPQPYANHNGGQLQVGPRDGHLYIGMGDGGAGYDPECSGQDKGSLLGKLLRLDIRQSRDAAPYHGIPADNPFLKDPRVLDVIWALGLRNPWRFSFDRQTGDLWIADVGQDQREEIHRQPAGSQGGENYGWRTMEGTRCLERPLCPGAPPCGDPSFETPIHEYDHTQGCSITGGYVYRGKRIPALQGTYVFGDYCTTRIWGLSRRARRYRARTLVERAGERLATFGEDVHGELYVAAGDQVLRLVASGSAAGAHPEQPAQGQPGQGATTEQPQGDSAQPQAEGLPENTATRDDEPPAASAASRAWSIGIGLLILLCMGFVLWALRRA